MRTYLSLPGERAEREIERERERERERRVYLSRPRVGVDRLLLEMVEKEYIICRGYQLNFYPKRGPFSPFPSLTLWYIWYGIILLPQKQRQRKAKSSQGI